MFKGMGKILLLSLAACMALADQTIDYNATSTVISNGSENVRVENNGSVTADGNDINITDTLQSGYGVGSDGNLTSSGGVGIYLAKDNNGTVYNDTRGIVNSKQSAIFINGNNNGTVANNNEINSSDGSGIEVNEDNTYSIANEEIVTALNGSGIKVTGTNSGGVKNDGNINANIGINVNVNGVRGVISNSNSTNMPTIDTNQSSILVGENDGYVANEGILGSTDGSGIEVDGNNTGYINNRNIINASNGSGIEVKGTNFKIIENDGNINANIGINVVINDDNGSIENDGGDIESDLSVVFVNENYGDIINGGMLRSTNGDGIEITGNNTGNVYNDDTIISDNGNGIEINGDNNGSVISSISINALNGSGIKVEDNYKTVENEENGGVINAYYGIKLDVNEKGAEVINGGSIDSNQTSVLVNSNYGNIENNGVLLSENGNGIEIANNDGNVTNTNTIQAAVYGIKINTNDYNAAVLNKGAITSSQSSILINDNNGDVKNENTLTSINGDGVEIENVNYGTVENDYEINATNAKGLYVNDNEGVIENYGRIDANEGISVSLNGENAYITNESGASVYSSGISLNIEENDGNVTNDGLLSAGNNGIVVAKNYGNIFNGADGNITSDENGIYITTQNEGHIVNEGIINGTYDGIYLNDNNSTVLNDKNGLITSSSGCGIYISGDNYETLQNDGNITSYNTAINVTNNDGNITNNGSLTSKTGRGIYVGTNTKIVENTNYISSGSYGIKIKVNDGGLLLNDENAVITSRNGSAIYLTANDNNASVINRGKLTSTYSKGIEIDGDNNGTVLNDTTGTIDSYGASITVEGINYQDVINKGSLTSIEGNGVKIDENYGNTENYGSISASNNNGIEVSNNYNTGTILNAQTGEINSSDSAIYVSENNDGNVTNEGKLVSTEENGIEIREENYGNVVNRGTVISTNRNGIDVSDNYGVVLNDTDGNITAQYAGIYIEGKEAGTIINNGTITASFSLLTNGASGQFINNGTAAGSIRAPGAGVINSGKIDLGVKDYIKADTFTQNASGVLNMGMEVNSTTLSAETSKVYAYKNIVFKDGGTINVNIYNTSKETLGKWFDTLSNSKISGYKDFNNSEGIIAESKEGNITADINKLNFTDNSSLLVFSAENNGTVMSLIVRKNEAGLETVVDSEGDIYAKGAAKALDEIFSSSNINKDIDRFLTSLDAQATDKEKAQGIAEMTPVGVLNVSGAVLQNGTAVSSAIQARQRGANSGDMMFKDRNLWIKPYYTYTTQDDRDGYKGFSARTGGFVIGADGEYGESRRAGMAFAYGRISVYTNGLPQSSDIDSYTLTAYGSNPVIDSDTMMSYQAGFGIEKTDSSRYISTTNQKADASYTAKLFYAQAVIDKNIEIKDDLAFVPKVKMAYKYYHSPSYSESGAGGLDLNVKGYNTEEFIIGAGGALNYSMDMNTVLRAYANVNYNTLNDRQTVSASFEGAENVVFQTEGIKNSAASFSGGMSINKKLQNNTSFSIGFNIDGKTSGFTSRNVFARYNMKF